MITRAISALPPGTAFDRYLASVVHHGGTSLAARWPDTPQVARVFELREKTAVTAGDTIDSVWASPLVETGIAAELLKLQSREHRKAINLHFHDLRHEAGSRWLESGAFQLHHVQRMLGHADLKQTSTYLNATMQGIEESMRKHDEARGFLQSVAQQPEIAHRPDCNDDQSVTATVTIN